MPNLEPLPEQVINFERTVNGEVGALMVYLFEHGTHELYGDIGNGQMTKSLISDRWDAPTEQNPEGDGLALRIQSIPSIEVLGGTVPDEESASYKVLMLEYGVKNELAAIDLDDDDGDGEEEESNGGDLFDWCNYVVVIMNPDKPHECSVVNAQTGVDLDNSDLFNLRILLAQWMYDKLDDKYQDVFSSSLLDTEVLRPTRFELPDGSIRMMTDTVPIYYPHKRAQ